MKLAITGANGFVGSNLIKHFQSCGHEVYALIRPEAKINLLPPDTSIRKVNYRDINSLTEAFAGIDVLIHNAGKTKALSHDEMLKANLGVTQNIIHALNTFEHPIQLIYISSQAASKPSYGNIPVKESDACAPLTSYGKSKLAAEEAIRSSCNKDFTIIRPCSVYGGGDRDFLTLFKMVNHGFSFQIGKTDKLLNMIHVSELTAFIGQCVLNPMAYGETFFATDGQVYRQSEVLKAIAVALHKTPNHIVIPDSAARFVFACGDVIEKITKHSSMINREKMKEIMAESWLADPSKAKSVLGWEPIPQLQLHIMETAVCYRDLAWL